MKLPPPPPDTPTLGELREVFAAVPVDHAPAWGRMNAGQMLEHCHRFNELCLGRVKVGAFVRVLARMIGPFFLRRLLGRSAQQSPKNLRTLEPIRVGDEVCANEARAHLMGSIDALNVVSDGHRHPLYGAMHAVDVQNLARHHMAHHAHQFGLW